MTILTILLIVVVILLLTVGFGTRAIAVILTGFGNAGATAIKRLGGTLIVSDREMLARVRDARSHDRRRPRRPRPTTR